MFVGTRCMSVCDGAQANRSFIINHFGSEEGAVSQHFTIPNLVTGEPHVFMMDPSVSKMLQNNACKDFDLMIIKINRKHWHISRVQIKWANINLNCTRIYKTKVFISTFHSKCLIKTKPKSQLLFCSILKAWKAITYFYIVSSISCNYYKETKSGFSVWLWFAFICQHNFKKIRNNVEKSHKHSKNRFLQHGDQEITWKQFSGAFRHDLKSNSLKSHHRLTPKHFTLKSTNRMRNHLAYDVLGDAMCELLQVCISKRKTRIYIGDYAMQLNADVIWNIKGRHLITK